MRFEVFTEVYEIVSSHQEESKCFMNISSVWTGHCTLDVCFDMAKLIILIPLSILIYFKLSFLIITLKRSLSAFALKSPNRIFM
jgi:hypothetical protein